MNVDIVSLVVGFGAGGIIGYLIGYAARKLAALVALAFGLFLLGIFGLASVGILTVDLASLNRFLEQLLIRGLETGNFILDSVFSGMPWLAGVVVGAFAGLLKSPSTVYYRRRVLRSA